MIAQDVAPSRLLKHGASRPLCPAAKNFVDFYNTYHYLENIGWFEADFTKAGMPTGEPSPCIRGRTGTARAACTLVGLPLGRASGAGCLDGKPPCGQQFVSGVQPSAALPD